jgi:hypothetical protein
MQAPYRKTTVLGAGLNIPSQLLRHEEIKSFFRDSALKANTDENLQTAGLPLMQQNFQCLP